MTRLTGSGESRFSHCLGLSYLLWSLIWKVVSVTWSDWASAEWWKQLATVLIIGLNGTQLTLGRCKLSPKLLNDLQVVIWWAFDIYLYLILYPLRALRKL
jgi:hypothetical protein